MAQRSPKLVDLARIVVERFYDDKGMQAASSLTFTTLLSIVPIVTVALTVITAFPVFGQLTAALQTFILDYLVPDSAEIVATYTQQFTSNAAKLTAVGIGFLVVTSLMLLLTIDRAFNDIWRVKRSRSIVQRLFVYWTLITIGPILVGASLTLTSWLVGHAVGLVQGLRGASVALLTIVPIILTSIALALLYAAMPNRRIRLRDAIVGGVLGGVAFEIMKRGFAFYIAYFPSYTLVYGAFATVPIFLLWIYVSWLVVLFGAVVVASLPEWREGAGQTAPAPGSDFFDALQILKILWRAHHNGEVVRLAEVLAVASVRIEQIETILDALVGAGWVSRTAAAGWVMHRDPSTITVDDVYRLFVFRGEAHRPARGADAELDALVHELGARGAAVMQVPIDQLFQAAQSGEGFPPASAGPGRAAAAS